MATKKAKHAAAVAKRVAYLAKVREEGDSSRRTEDDKRFSAFAAEINYRHNEILSRSASIRPDGTIRLVRTQ